jgi:hypothetical protein
LSNGRSKIIYKKRRSKKLRMRPILSLNFYIQYMYSFEKRLKAVSTCLTFNKTWFC